MKDYLVVGYYYRSSFAGKEKVKATKTIKASCVADAIEQYNSYYANKGMIKGYNVSKGEALTVAEVVWSK